MIGTAKVMPDVRCKAGKDSADSQESEEGCENDEPEARAKCVRG